MADIGKEVKKVNEDLTQIGNLAANPMFKYLLYALGIVAFVVLVLLLKIF